MLGAMLQRKEVTMNPAMPIITGGLRPTTSLNGPAIN
jgi:hypothetical protein